jgi:rSAM/selenodomain-associated transferase 1
VRLLVFAREPEPGRVKTRLIPALGAQGAATLYAALLDRVLSVAAASAVGALELWADRAPAGAGLRARSEALGIELRVQSGGDIGVRMDDALTRVLAEGACPVLVGSDLPGLTVEHFRSAAAAFEAGAEAVFAPADDGGYGLVGLARPRPSLFAAMRWSTADVMAETARRLDANAVPWRRIAPVWDVDDPADLPRLATLPDFAPLLATLGWTQATG